MENNKDNTKQWIVINVINFLQNELIKGCLNDEKKESIDVAIQCLETAFEIDTQTREKYGNEIDLISIFPKPHKDVDQESKIAAEECKNRGNNYMKNQQYNEAVTEYTKALELNPNNAIYFCNRAAAFSRLEKHWEAVEDCKEAIKLDPTYGKAYGRLGIAYSNLQKFDEARKAYLTALKYDPSNTMYETNLKLAEERLFSRMGKDIFSTQGGNPVPSIISESAAPPEHRPVDISEFINNPNFPDFINNPSIINMATQMLSDPNFCNMMSGLIGPGGTPNLDALLQAGQSLASRMRSVDPNIAEAMTRMVNAQSSSSSQSPNEEQHSVEKPNPGNDNNS